MHSDFLSTLPSSSCVKMLYVSDKSLLWTLWIFTFLIPWELTWLLSLKVAVMSATDIAMEHLPAHKSPHICANREHDHKVKRVVCDTRGVSMKLCSPIRSSHKVWMRVCLQNYKFVSNSWAAWYYANIHTIAHASRQDERPDWCFPFSGKFEKLLGRTMELTWRQIWHAELPASMVEQRKDVATQFQTILSSSVNTPDYSLSISRNREIPHSQSSFCFEWFSYCMFRYAMSRGSSETDVH